MSASIYDFSKYQKIYNQTQRLKSAGWDSDSVDCDYDKKLNIYLVDKNQPCLRFFNCNIKDIHSNTYGQHQHLQYFLKGWQQLQQPCVYTTVSHLSFTFTLAKHAIATLAQWKNLQRQKLRNQLGKNSHIIVVFDQQHEDKPLQLILV